MMKLTLFLLVTFQTGQSLRRIQITPSEIENAIVAPTHIASSPPSDFNIISPELANAEQFKEHISIRVNRMFNNADNDHRGNVYVTAASPGAWNKTLSCQTPKLWIYVYGLYRTFDRTRDTLRQMASKSSNDCYFVSAVVPDDSGMYTKMIENQAFFGGRMAFTIISRQGMYNRPGNMKDAVWKPPSAKENTTFIHATEKSLQPALDVFWYLLQQATKFATPMLGIIPQPSSVLIRTRFDVVWTKYYTLDNLMKFFESSPRGAHLAFGNEAHGGQGDYSFITSYSAYGADIADAYEYDTETKTGPFPSTARANGWGYGYSMCGFRTHGKCSDQTNSAFVDIGKSQYCMERASGQLEAQCCAGGRACALTMVYSEHLTSKNMIIKEGKKTKKNLASELPLAGPFDVTKKVHLYCPTRQDEKDSDVTPNYVLNYGGRFYFSANAHDLVDDHGEVMNPWGVGC